MRKSSGEIRPLLKRTALRSGETALRREKTRGGEADFCGSYRARLRPPMLGPRQEDAGKRGGNLA